MTALAAAFEKAGFSRERLLKNLWQAWRRAEEDHPRRPLRPRQCGEAIMSNFIHPAFDPVAGVVRDATWIDNYFGPHKYGVQFDAGGPVYRPDQAEVAAAGKCIAALRSKLAAAEAREAQLREALEIIAGKRQCIDNLMGNVDVAEWALKHTQPSDYRERVRREAFEDAAKVADDFEARWDAQWRAEHKGSSHLEGKSDGAGEIAFAIRALGDSNANG